MTPYETLEYMLKGTDLIGRINTEPFEIRLRELYYKCGSVPDYILKGIIDESISEKDLYKALDKYEHLDTLIDEFSILMNDLSNV